MLGCFFINLELLKLFCSSCCFGDFEDVKPNCFAQGSAFADSDDVSDSDISVLKKESVR